MDRLNKEFKSFFERRDYLDSIASQRGKAYEHITPKDALGQVVQYYKEDVLPKGIVSTREAVDEIEEFLQFYSIAVPGPWKKIILDQVLNYSPVTKPVR